jgi:FLVCR family MFS transporter
MAAPSVFSATWFPPSQRTTATALGAMMNLLGVASSFFVGTALVTDGRGSGNGTSSRINTMNLAEYEKVVS